MADLLYLPSIILPSLPPFPLKDSTENEEQPIWPEPQAVRLVELLSVASSANLLIFAAVVVAGSLPVALLNTYWQLRVIALLTENGGFALMGFILIHLAAWLAPDHPQLNARCSSFRSLAVAATIGYLLLIPLQPLDAWTSIAQQKHLRTIEQRRINQQFDDWEAALTTASDLEELRRHFQTLNGPEIAEADWRKPWNSLRRQLLQGLNKARADALKGQPGPSSVELWEVAQVSLRRMTVAFALAMGFAAGAELPGAQCSLLQGWLLAFQQQRIRRAWRRQKRREQAEQQRLLRQNLSAVEQCRQERPRMAPAEPGHPGLPPSLLYTFDFTADGNASMEGLLPESNDAEALQWLALEDNTLVLSIRWSSNGFCLLTFNRAVRLYGFTVAKGIAPGMTHPINFGHGGQLRVEVSEDWQTGLHYVLAESQFLESEESLQLEGAAPIQLNDRDGAGPTLLQLAAITVLAEPPSLRMALKEELQIWRRRLTRRAKGKGFTGKTADGD